jgi:nitrogen fixation NifU-like protein
MYSAQVLDHFKNPRNAGELENAAAQVECSNPACGDILQLAARIANGRIVEARFKARGCVTTIACGSLVTEMMLGKTPSEARMIAAAAISEAMGSLPPATQHASELAAEACAALCQALLK